MKDSPTFESLGTEVAQTIASLPSFADVPPGEVVTMDIDMVRVRGQTRLALSGRIGADDTVFDYLKDEVEPLVDMRKIQSGSETIGSLSIRGDGEVTAVEIADEYKL